MKKYIIVTLIILAIWIITTLVFPSLYHLNTIIPIIMTSLLAQYISDLFYDYFDLY